MARGQCTPEEIAACPLQRHFSDNHHVWWPARDYRTPLEKRFRNLPENQVQTCRFLHNQIHFEGIPEKPSTEEMRRAIAGIAIEGAEGGEAA